MKKALCLLVTLVIAASFTACKKQNTADASPSPENSASAQQGEATPALADAEVTADAEATPSPNPSNTAKTNNATKAPENKKTNAPTEAPKKTNAPTVKPVSVEEVYGEYVGYSVVGEDAYRFEVSVNKDLCLCQKVTATSLSKYANLYGYPDEATAAKECGSEIFKVNGKQYVVDGSLPIFGLSTEVTATSISFEGGDKITMQYDSSKKTLKITSVKVRYPDEFKGFEGCVLQKK